MEYLTWWPGHHTCSSTGCCRQDASPHWLFIAYLLTAGPVCRRRTRTESAVGSSSADSKYNNVQCEPEYPHPWVYLTFSQTVGNYCVIKPENIQIRICMLVTKTGLHTTRGIARNLFRRGQKLAGIWGTEDPQRGPGVEP